VLCRRLAGVSRKVVHESLKELMADGLVEKVIGADDVGSPSVTYGLTTLGASLAPVLDAMQAWCTLHLGQLLAARDSGEPPIRVERR
jgi:DNA-binding HxlR family transcriptional regulator